MSLGYPRSFGVERSKVKVRVRVIVLGLGTAMRRGFELHEFLLVISVLLGE